MPNTGFTSLFRAIVTGLGQNRVTIYDENGSVATLGGGTQYARGTAKAAAQVTTLSGVYRADTAAAQDSNGQITALIVDATGQLWVDVGLSVLPTGAATEATLSAAAASLSILDDWDESDRAKVNLIAGQVGVQGGSGVVTALTQRMVLATDVGLPAGSALLGGVTLPAVAVAASVTSVAGSASSVQLLASTAGRKGYGLYNDSTAVAYVKKGTTATTSDYSFQIQPGGYYADTGVACYTGRVDCIWAAANGAMKITEDS